MRTIIMGLCMAMASHGAFKKVDKEIRPFDYRDFSLVTFIKDYAEVSGETIMVSSAVGAKLRERKLNLALNDSINIDAFRNLMISLLKTFGYTLYKENGFSAIMNERNVRYLPSPIIDASEVDKDRETYTLAAFKTKYPMASEISRNLRPFISRYGRVISLSNARLLLIHDTEKNISSLKSIISVMDSKEAYLAQKENKKKKALSAKRKPVKKNATGVNQKKGKE